MAQTQRPAFQYDHSERGNVLVQDLTDWSGEIEGIDTVECEWLDRASQSQITAAVTIFSGEMTLSPITQDHLAEEWSENAAAVDLDRIAFVSAGTEARAVSDSLDVEQEIRTFGSLDAAMDWAREHTGQN